MGREGAERGREGRGREGPPDLAEAPTCLLIYSSSMVCITLPCVLLCLLALPQVRLGLAALGLPAGCLGDRSLISASASGNVRPP